MFTGLIESTAQVMRVTPKQNKTIEIEVVRPTFFDDLQKGHSVANNGVCLTVTNDEPSSSERLVFDIGEESIKVTNLKALKEGDWLNLERPMKLNERLHGHIVTGHVDEVLKVSHVEQAQEGCMILSISGSSQPEYLWPKGSVVVNGVSLTLNEVDEKSFSLCLIPETLKKTNLSQLKVGDLVNIEYDYLAKTVIHASKFK